MASKETVVKEQVKDTVEKAATVATTVASGQLPTKQQALDAAHSASESLASVAEVVKTVAEGGIPTSQQATSALNTTAQTIKEAAEKISLDNTGKKIVDDTEQLLEDTKRLLQEKRVLDKLGKLVEDTKEAGSEISQKVPDWNYIESKAKEEVYEGLGKEAADLLNTARRVAFQIVKSKDFRMLLIDAVDLMQAMFYRAVDTIPPVADSLKKDIAKGKLELPETKKVAEEFTRTVSQKVEQVKETGVVLPQEHKERIQRQFNSLMSRIANNKEYHELVHGLFRILQHLKQRAQKLKEYNPAESEAWQKVWADIIDIIESFSGKGTFKSFSKRINYVLTDLWNDKEADAVFRDIKSYLSRAMEHPNWLTTKEATDKATDLLERLNDLVVSDKYQRRLEQLSNQARYVLTRIANEPLVQKIADDAAQLGKDIITNVSTGKPSLTQLQQSLAQIRTVIVPILMKQLEQIPLPIVSGSTPKFDYSLDNLIFGAKELMPEKIYMKFDDFVEVNTRDMALKQTTAYLLLQM